MKYEKINTLTHISMCIVVVIIIIVFETKMREPPSSHGVREKEGRDLTREKVRERENTS